nr:hypothetical protein [Tanacetum cinerariifolium]
MSKVPDTKDTIKFMLDAQQITYIVNMFRDTLHLLVETLEKLFVAPANIHTSKAFMNRVGYQGVVNKVSAFYTKNMAQPWQIMFKDFMKNVFQKKKVIQYPCFIKLIVVDLMKTFPKIPKRNEEDYAFLTTEIRETNDFKEYEMVFMKVDVLMNQPQPVVSTQGTHRITPSTHRSPIISASPPESKKRNQIAGESSSPRKSLKITITQKKLVEKDDDDYEDMIEPESHKDNQEVVDDDDHKEKENQDDRMGSLDELTDTVSNPTISTSKHLTVKKRISSKYSHLPGALRMMCRRQVVPQIAENVTNDLIETNLKPCIVNTIIEDRDAFRSEIPAFVSQKFKAHALAIIEELFKNHMKRNLQDRADDIALWEALRRKFEKYSSNTSCREDAFHSHHDEHQDDDAPLEGEKRVKRSKESKRSKSTKGSSSKHSRKDSTTYVSKQQSQQQEWDLWEEENVIDEDEVNPEDVTPELTAESQNVDKRVPTIFDHARMEATLRDSLSNLSRNAEEYAYHLEQSTNFMENQIVWESRQQDIPRTIPKTLIFYGPQRDPNEPLRPLYNKDLFFLRYGNTKEKKYILSLHKIHAEEFLEPDLEEKLKRWVQKEFKTFNEDARLSIQHWKDSWNKRVYEQNQKKVRKNPEDYYSNHMITKVVRIVTDQPHGLDFMEQILVMRANDKPDSFSEADFKYLNKNDIEDLYYLCRSKEIDNQKVKLMNSLITFIRSCVIWERVHDFQVGIESYQMKVNLTAPTLTFPGIEEHAPYTIVDELRMGLIYLNSKEEKRVMYLEEIVKFCDATLEKVLNEVKLGMFESKILKKPPLLGKLDQDIMKAYEREISKRPSHRQQMRRWKSFVNGRPILLTMKRL